VTQFLAERLLLVLGVGFLVANLQVLAGLVRYWRVRGSALVIWPARRPANLRVFVLLAAALALVIVVKLGLQRRPVSHAFGELMMFLYYGVLVPLSLKVARGFYADGVWAEGGFLPYARIAGISWREQPDPVLMLIPRRRRVVRRLVVPRDHYAEARRILRDQIAEHRIHFASELDLGGHDQREDV
jgi:hypothetical protein